MIIIQCLLFPFSLIVGILINNRKFKYDKNQTSLFIMANHLSAADFFCSFVHEFESLPTNERSFLISKIFSVNRFVSLDSRDMSKATAFYSSLNINEKDILLNFYKESHEKTISEEKNKDNQR
jgi:hypothetical protein